MKWLKNKGFTTEAARATISISFVLKEAKIILRTFFENRFKLLLQASRRALIICKETSVSLEYLNLKSRNFIIITMIFIIIYWLTFKNLLFFSFTNVGRNPFIQVHTTLCEFCWLWVCIKYEIRKFAWFGTCFSRSSRVTVVYKSCVLNPTFTNSSTSHVCQRLIKKFIYERWKESNTFQILLWEL